MARRIDGLRTGLHTPEQALRAEGLEGKVTVQALVAAAKPHDLKNPGYLSRDELARGAADLKAALPPKVGAPKATARTNLVAAMRAAQDPKGAALGPVAPSAIPGFSVDTHVMPEKASHLESEYFFGIQLRRIPYVFSDRLIRGGQLEARSAELAARVAKEGPLELPGGVSARLVNVAPKVSDYFPAQPPLVALQRGEQTVYLETRGFGLSAVLVEGADVIGKVAYMDMGARFGDLLGEREGAPMAALEMKFALGGGASPQATAALARIIDAVYAGGAGVPAIDAAEQAAQAMTGEALGKYFAKTGAVAAFQAAAAHVKAHGPAEGLGDYDMTIKTAPALKNGRRVVARDAGPLLVFDNHASGATSGVRLDALAEGKLEVLVAYEGKLLGKLAFDADGKATDLTGLGFASIVAFNAQFWVKELLEGQG